ncbi:ATP-binding cassette domain-containing protein [Streptomyces sp. NPDC053431]|uniref:ABC transporter ATP-binding protein n=1 Tax=Streptomyces sp. NPDC053431 TaxID=3365703 RepID=UPI0037D6EDFF
MLQAIGLTSTPRRDLPPAVDDLSFEARPGTVTALLGPAGAGKTTTLRLMLQLEPGRGVTYFRGRPLHRVAHPAREVGVLLGDVPGHPSRTLRSQLRMLCAAAGVPGTRADDMLQAVGLTGIHDQRIGTLSRGMDRRLGLASALLGDPHTLLLDEPGAGLSVRESAWLHELLRAHADEGGTVLYTTADPKDAARNADRVVTLDGGRLAADQDAADFTRTRLRPRVAVRTPHAARLAAVLVQEARAARRPVEVVTEGGNRLSVYGSDCATVGESAFRNGVLIHQLADEVGAAGDTGGAGGSGGPGSVVGTGGAGGSGDVGGARGGRARPALAGGAYPHLAGRTHPTFADFALPASTGPASTGTASAGTASAGTASAATASARATPFAPSTPSTPSIPSIPSTPATPATAAAEVPVSRHAAVRPSGHRPAGHRPAGHDPAEEWHGDEAPAGKKPAWKKWPRKGRAGEDFAAGGTPSGGRAVPERPVARAARARRAPCRSPLRPLRYEIRRLLGVPSTPLVFVGVLLVSVTLAVLLARGGRTPLPALLAGWPGISPLPPAAVGAGLLGAFSFGEEYRYPALTTGRGAVPRRLGLLLAKLAVAAAVGAVLAVLVVVADLEALRLVCGDELIPVPENWSTLCANWFGLVVGCAWAGVLGAGVFRAAAAGVAAVLAVPVLFAPPLQRVLAGAPRRSVTGLPARLREFARAEWASAADRWLLGALRVVGQPVGVALTLTLTVLLCAYVLTGRHSRARW